MGDATVRADSGQGMKSREMPKIKDTAKWLNYRDFTIKMLKEEGYEME